MGREVERGCECKIPANEPRRLLWNKGSASVVAVTEPRRAPLQQYQNPPPEIDRPKGPVGARPYLLAWKHANYHARRANEPHAAPVPVWSQVWPVAPKQGTN